MDFREIPSVDALLRDAGARALLDRYPRTLVVEAFREAADDLRHRIAQRSATDGEGEATWIVSHAERSLARLATPSLRRVINATGVVLHTNLGRAPLSEEALAAVAAAGRGYSNLELELAEGERGSRYAHVAGLLRKLTGAEAALVVNNCAAAVMLVADTFARGRDVVVSRGEMIEIGGSYRLPDVLEASGARLVGVGTTNKTYLHDYERALRAETGLIMVSHRSNYAVVGFTHDVPPADVAALGRTRGVPTCMDLGSGLMVDPRDLGLSHGEPTVPAMVEAGFDAVTFSGDKLLGGPQAGVIVGRREAVERLRKSPMNRALRIDKLTLAALEATLRAYLGDGAGLPVVKMLRMRGETLQARAQELAGQLRTALGERAQVSVQPGASSVGGGSLPGEDLPTWLVSVLPSSGSESRWAARLRQADPPVVALCREGAVWVDVRTLRPGDDADLVRAFAETA